MIINSLTLQLLWMIYKRSTMCLFVNLLVTAITLYSIYPKDVFTKAPILFCHWLLDRLPMQKEFMITLKLIIHRLSLELVRALNILSNRKLLTMVAMQVLIKQEHQQLLVSSHSQ